MAEWAREVRTKMSDKIKCINDPKKQNFMYKRRSFTRWRYSTILNDLLYFLFSLHKRQLD